MSAELSTRLSALTLGTVQLGMPYGIANPQSLMPDEEASRILDAACAEGIAALDTARGYGTAEERIGGWRREHRSEKSDFLLISKFPSLRNVGTADVAATLAGHLDRTLFALDAERLDAYLCHDATDFLRPEVRRCLADLKAKGRVGAVGLSAYRSEPVLQALDHGDLDIVQAPLNIFDQRLVTSGALDRCARSGITVLARSVFLQGLFFRHPDTLPAYFEPAAKPLLALRRAATASGMGIDELALLAVRDQPGIASMVFGAYSAEQVRTNSRAAARPALDATIAGELRRLGEAMPVEILEPSRWLAPE